MSELLSIAIVICVIYLIYLLIQFSIHMGEYSNDFALDEIKGLKQKNVEVITEFPDKLEYTFIKRQV